MLQTDPRDTEFIHAAAAAVGRLMIAVDAVDHASIAHEVTRLLGAISRHNAAMRERAGDAPLRAAVAALNDNWRHP